MNLWSATSRLYWCGSRQLVVLDELPNVKPVALVNAAGRPPCPSLYQWFSRSPVFPELQISTSSTRFGRCVPPNVPALLLFCQMEAGIPLCIVITGVRFQPPSTLSTTPVVAHRLPLTNGRSHIGIAMKRCRTSLTDRPYSRLML